MLHCPHTPTEKLKTHPFEMPKPKSTKPLEEQLPVPVEMIERRIYLIRGHKVMLDSDLAELYGVTTGNLNLAVRRNSKRFPSDFLFQLTSAEVRLLLLDRKS